MAMPPGDFFSINPVPGNTSLIAGCETEPENDFPTCTPVAGLF